MFLYISDLSKNEVRGDEASHWLSLRPEACQVFTITDLQGKVARAQVEIVDKKAHLVRYKVISSQNNDRKPPRILFQAVTDKLYLEKMAEVVGVLGIENIYLFFADNSIKFTLNIQRLEKILIRSNEQSQQMWQTKIEFLEVSHFLKMIEVIKPAVLELPEKYSIESQNNINKNAVLVGPEGGWSKNEISLFQSKNLPIYGLGESVYPSWLAGFSFFVSQF